MAQSGSLEQTSSEVDFSKPLPLSDVVLVVEDKRFHVHRGLLAILSPVFYKMFTSNFKEKSMDEVLFPAKKAEEIEEMLLVIYPTSTKPISESNYSYLLALAQEYQIDALTKRCETFLLQLLSKSDGSNVLDLLIVSQSYDLKRLKDACLEKGKSLDLYTLINHESYKEIEESNYRKLVEGRIALLEKRMSHRRF